MSANTYLDGNFAPVADEITVTDLRVTGTLPPQLNGRYLRIGPNPVAADPETYHWFMGEGMVHGVRLGDGRASWYRNRWVRNGVVNEHLDRAPTPGPANPMFDSSPNTNVIAHAGQTLAIVEAGGLPMVLDDTVETLTRSNFDDTLPDAFTAHPKRDPHTGELHAVTYYWEHPGVRYLVVGVDGKVRHRVDVDLGASVMVHDCALTESSVLLFDLPCVFDLDEAMKGRFPYIWSRQRAARVGVLPRHGGAADISWIEIDPCYVFHPMNAYDLPDGRVVVDVPRHPSVFDTVRSGPDEGRVRFERWTLDPVAGAAKTELIDDRGFEFPRIDERRLGGEHRYGYGIGSGNDLIFGSVVRHDLTTGERVARTDTDGYAWGEVVFVPRHDGAAEADGWLMGLRYDIQADTSDLVLLDADDVDGTPVAEVHLPRRVPFGFHGNWLPDH